MCGLDGYTHHRLDVGLLESGDESLVVVDTGPIYLSDTVWQQSGPRYGEPVVGHLSTNK